jgi:hypothetical protein
MKKTPAFALVLAGLALVPLWGCGADSAYHQAYVRGCNIRSMTTIEGVALALEQYKQAHGSYPVAKSVPELQTALAALLKGGGYTDRWGEPLLVDVSPDGYTLTSKGDDRTGSHEFGGAVTTPGHSITLKDGMFVQYDASVEKTAREFEAEIAKVRAQARQGV